MSSFLGFVGSLSIPLLFFLFIFSPYFNSSLCFYVVWQQLPLGEALLILRDSWDKDISSSQSQQTNSSRPPDFSLSSLILIIFFNLHMTAPYSQCQPSKTGFPVETSPQDHLLSANTPNWIHQLLLLLQGFDIEQRAAEDISHPSGEEHAITFIIWQ